MSKFVEIRELTEQDEGCLKCTLIAPQCNKKEPGCVFAQITREPVTRPCHSPGSRAKTSVTKRLAFGWVRDENGNWIAKRCGGDCKKVLPLGEFYKKGDGLNTECKQCQSDRRKKRYRSVREMRAEA